MAIFPDNGAKGAEIHLEKAGLEGSGKCGRGSGGRAPSVFTR